MPIRPRLPRYGSAPPSLSGAGLRSPSSRMSRSPRRRSVAWRSFDYWRSSGASMPTSRSAVTPTLVPELETLVAQHPLREGLRAQLMLALYRGGPAGRGTRGVSRRAPHAGRGARHRARAGAEGAREGNPAPGSGASTSRVAERPQRSILVAGARRCGARARSLAVAEPLARKPPREVIVVRLLDEAVTISQRLAAGGRNTV